MSQGFKSLRAALMGASALVAAVSFTAPAQAQTSSIQFDQPAQPLASALRSYSAAADREIIFADALVAGRTAPELKGAYTAEGALTALLDGTGLSVSRTRTGVLLVQEAAAPQSGSAAGDGAEVEALIVTAQKREEDIQDVPIAISAFTQEALDAQKIEGGFDLLKAIPNVTFSKNNFTSYNFSIRGVGTKAISVTTDPGVAVSFNNTTLIRNRLFEQEYFDVARVEVLRGPQGTLYGRNATSGVINVITAQPDLDEFKGSIKGEVGNFHTKRLTAMVNVPLVEDMLAIRLAGAVTTRDGYGYNEYTHGATDGRDLWSGRATVAFEPTERLSGNLIWERFSEDDDRTRTGKQLCHRDPGHIGEQVADQSAGAFALGAISQGCLPGSLYDDAAFGTPNGLSIGFMRAVTAGTFAGFDPGCAAQFSFVPECAIDILQHNVDPYGGRQQSRDLRAIYSKIDPHYMADADLLQLNLEFGLTPSLTLFSQTAYNEDTIYSTQDYNRYTTFPVFGDTAQSVTTDTSPPEPFTPSIWRRILPGGIFCDPQLGCSDTIVGQDISRAKSVQFSQELRLQSDFDGIFNFSAGAGYTQYRTLEDYFVLFNGITLDAQMLNAFSFHPLAPGEDKLFPNCNGETLPTECIYIDPNPLESINGEGHNYFRSKNPYKVKSWALFGEGYWRATETLKVTAGLRYTDDRKRFTPVPSKTLITPLAQEWVDFLNALPSPSTVDGLKALYGAAPGGYPADPDIAQHWGEFSGRLGIDWTPDVGFTDETMLYAFYSRGYKGGGANPPQIGNLIPKPLSAPKTFDPEFVNASEVGAKNTLLGGALILNATGFYYDYDGYQISKIVDRSAANENFDATVWGLELEGLFQPTRNLRFNGTFGYLDTEISSGLSIDVMNRNQDDPNWTVIKPQFTLSSNCVVPTAIVQERFDARTQPPAGNSIYDIQTICYGGTFPGGSWNPLDHPEINFGAGYYADVSGNELPNAPHWTTSLGAQYTYEFREGWQATIRADGYWQSQSWARVYNTEIDKLHGWYNANLSLWLENDNGLKIELYAKNILDDTPITDAFINSDDTSLTTNVFVLDPRLIGLSVRKEF